MTENIVDIKLQLKLKRSIIVFQKMVEIKLY